MRSHACRGPGKLAVAVGQAEPDLLNDVSRMMKRSTKTKLHERRREVTNYAPKNWTQAASAWRMNIPIAELARGRGRCGVDRTLRLHPCNVVTTLPCQRAGFAQHAVSPRKQAYVIGVSEVAVVFRFLRVSDVRFADAAGCATQVLAPLRHATRATLSWSTRSFLKCCA